MKCNAGDLQCFCCTDCTTAFQMVVDLKNAGLVIYRHTIQTEDVNKDTGIIESATKTTEDVFILHNTKDIDITSADCLPEIEQSKIKCPRCRRIIENAQNLLQKLPTINRNDVKGVCEHCRMKDASCFECTEVVKKFITSKTERTENTKERVKMWLSKIKYLLKGGVVDPTKMGHERARAHSELLIDHLGRRASPEARREPVVKQMFHPAHASDSVGAFPQSIEKKNKMFTHFPEREKDEHPVVYLNSPRKGGLSAFQSIRMHKSDRDTYLSDSESDDWRVTFHSPTTDKESQKQKKDKHVEIKDYIPQVPFHSEEDFVAGRGNSMSDDGRSQRHIRPKSSYAPRGPVHHVEHLVKADKRARKDMMANERDTYESGLETMPVDYLENRKLEFKNILSLSKARKEDGNSYDARQENMVDYISKRKYLEKPDRYQKSELDEFSSDSSKKHSTANLSWPETMAADFHTKHPKKKFMDRYYDDRELLEIKTSLGSSKAEQRYSKEFRELSNVVRKYHSEECLLTTIGGITKDVLEQEFSFYFPKEVSAEKKLRHQKNSSELIKDTQDMLLARAEEEKRRLEKKHVGKLEEEERKKLARIERKKEHVAKITVEEENKNVDKKKEHLKEAKRPNHEIKETNKPEKVNAVKVTVKESRPVSEKKESSSEGSRPVLGKKESTPKEKKLLNKAREPPLPKEPKALKEARDPTLPKKSQPLKEAREPKLMKETKESKPSKEARDLTQSKEPKPPKEARESKSPKEAGDPKLPKEAREPQPPKEARGSKPPKETRELTQSKEPKPPKEARDSKSPKEAGDPKLPKEAREPQPPKEARGSKPPKEDTGSKPLKEARQPQSAKEAKKPKLQQEAREPKTQKETREPKPPKETREPKPPKEAREQIPLKNLPKASKEPESANEPSTPKEPLGPKPPNELKALKEQETPKERRDQKTPKESKETKPPKVPEGEEQKPLQDAKEAKSLNEPKKDKDAVKADKYLEMSRKEEEKKEKEEQLKKDKEAKENLKKEKEDKMAENKRFKQIQKDMAQQEKEEKRQDKEEIAKRKVKDAEAPSLKKIDEEQSKRADLKAREDARLKLKIALAAEVAAKPETEISNAPRLVEQSKKKDLNIKQIKIRKPSTDYDDLILRLVSIKQSTNAGARERSKLLADMKLKGVKKNIKSHKSDAPDDLICIDSNMELDAESILFQKIKRPKEEIIKGEKLFKLNPPLIEKTEVQIVPLVFQSTFEGAPQTSPSPSEPIQVVEELQASKIAPLTSGKQAKLQALEQEVPKGVIRYALSDRSFIDKGWTMLPTEKVVRKMNVYRMRPAHPEFDWFEHNKNKRLMCYDSGEKLAEFDDNGRGRWFYRSGRLALDYYDAAEINAQQRFVIYSSGEPDEKGRAQPYTILATFDYLGNGIVFDHSGKIRLKYNQTEGVVLDRSIGPVSHWKWHTLNDPPVLQQVMIDTELAHKDPTIMKLGGPQDNKTRPDNEDMLAIEFDNFIKEKSKKLTQTFKPFQIKMKALKINEHFSLRVLDQATVYLIYRDGTTNLKLNIGMVLDHKEIVDTDTAEVGEVSNSMEHFPARTDSLAGLQKSVAHAQNYERKRTERERRLCPPEPCASADKLTAAASRPLRRPFRTGPSSISTTPATNSFLKCSRKPTKSNVYYDSRL